MIIYQLLFCIFLFLKPVYSKEEPWVVYKGAGQAKFYRATDFYQQGHSDFPEMIKVNSRTYPILETFAQHLDASGVPILIGIDTNFNSYFDLYFPTLGRSLTSDPTTVGPNKESNLGHLSLLEHDSAHHFAGIPGLRRSDLLNIEETKKKLFEIILLKEVFATANTSLFYIPAYYDWKIEVPAEKKLLFQTYNQGFYTGLKPLSRTEHMNLVKYAVLGKFWDYLKLMREKLTAESLRKTRESGAPRAIPYLDKYVGKKLDHYLVSLLVPIVEPIHAYMIRKESFKGFSHYANKMVDISLQPWYVEWSDDFQVGIPLDKLKKRTLNLISQLEASDKIVDPDNPSGKRLSHFEWKAKFLRTEVSLFGKRLKEVSQLGIDESYLKKINQIYVDALNIDIELRQNVSDLKNHYENLKKSFIALVELANNELPVEEVIPYSYRKKGVSYLNFWENPYGFVIDRDIYWPGDLSASALEDLLKQNSHLKLGKSNLERNQKSLVQEYIKTQNHRQHNAQAPTSVGNLLSEIKIFEQNLEQLLEKSFLTQLPNLPLTLENKIKVETATKTFLKEVKNELSHNRSDSLFDLYHRIDETLLEVFSFLELTKSTKKTNVSPTSLLKAFKANQDTSLSHKGSEFKTIRPPGTLNSNPHLFVNLNLRHNSSTPLVLSPVIEYQSIADWLSTMPQQTCNKLLFK